MKFSKDSLLVDIGGQRLTATLLTDAIPADEVGRAHKKHFYKLSDGKATSYGWTKTEALKLFLQVATENGWIVLHRLA